MASTFTPLLKFNKPALGDTGWGTAVNSGFTDLADSAIAGTTTLSTDADVTLTTANGATDQARQMILNCTGSRAAQRTITAPAASKVYVVINGTSGGFGVKLVGVGPTTGVVVPAGRMAVLAWNGSDFVTLGAVVDLTASGNVSVAGTTTLAALNASGNVSFDGGTFVFNEAGADRDARFEGDTDANLLFLDASTDRVGIGTSSPAAKLGVNGDASISGLTVGKGAGAIFTNTAVGVSALQSNTTGSGNTAIGISALVSNTTGGANTANGASALQSNTTGGANTANGASALYGNTTGGANTATGAYALLSNTTGNSNTALGNKAGAGTGSNSNTTGSNNTFIGNESVGASATASDVITLGNGSITTLRCQATTITSLSDARDKKNIVDIPAGLAFVQALRPVAFDWNTRNGAKVNIPEFGFIAQDLQQTQAELGVTVPNLVSTENPDKLEASYGTLIPILTKAIQEQQALITALTARVAALEAK